MRRPLYLLTVALLLTGCGKHLTYSSFSHNSLPQNRQRVGFITLDDSYRLYVRRLYEETVGVRKSLVTHKIQNLTQQGTLVEVEYLLISETKKNAIYISTISDHYQTRYSERDLPPNQLNAFDFKVILFGKLDALDKIVFQAKQGAEVDVWNLKYGQARSSLEIEGITEFIGKEFQLYIPVDKALENPVHFVGFEQYALVYQSTFDNKMLSLLPFLKRSDTTRVASFTGTIYFVRKCKWPFRSRCKNMRMYFPFDTPLVKKNQRLMSIYFKDNRIGSNPCLLFEE